MIAKKQIEKKQQGSYEIIRFHTMKVNNLTVDELSDIYDDWDDYEQAYENGVAIDFNDEVIWIDVDDFMIAIKGRLECIESEGDEEDSIEEDRLKAILPKLEKYKGYTIYVD